MRCKIFLLALTAFVPVLFVPPALPADPPEPDAAKLEKVRCPKPKVLASVFSFGYGGDHDKDMPKDDARFEALLIKLKEGGFNVVHCSYSDKRLELCKKHGILMMVHLLHEELHHVYKSPDKAQAVCEKLRDNPDVWGYNLWNDNIGGSTPGRKRDINNVRVWDPTHPGFLGTKNTSGMSGLTNPDVFGYYDFHWKRGIGGHFPHVMTYLNWARQRDAWCYSWLSTDSGLPGKGNFNRSLYSANTSMACGFKGFIWFIGQRIMNPGSQNWTALGGDIVKVNKEIMPLKLEIPKLGNPTAVYSTPITKDCNNRDVSDKKLPAGLDGNAFPKEFWIQPAGGEFLMGVFKDDQKRDAVFVANHNAYAEQKVALKLSKTVKASLFNRKEGKWQPLEVKDGTVNFPLDQAGGELLRFEE